MASRLPSYSTVARLHPSSDVDEETRTVPDIVDDQRPSTPIGEPQVVISAVSDCTMVTQQSSVVSNGHPIVMSWAGEVSDIRQAAPDTPPSYSAPVPTKPVTYTFSHRGCSTTLLLPPSNASDVHPLYNIDVSTNLFSPDTYITTIRRGTSWDGEYVGELQTSAKSGLEGFLTLYGKHTSLKDMVEVKRNNLIWSGRLSPPETAPLTLTWTCYNPGVASKKTPALDRTCVLHVSGLNITVAQFMAPPKLLLPLDGRQRPPATLTLLPAAYIRPGVVDRILLSAITVERYTSCGRPNVIM